MIVQQNKLSSGFTLLEILIALLIVSIGLLGVATLQIRGQQFNQVSYFRTQATFLAYDLMDRIRTNYPLMIQPNAPETIYDTGGFIKGTTLSDQCDNNFCNSSQLAAYDLQNWLYWLGNSLPDGEGNVAVTTESDSDGDGINDRYTITIRWKNIVDDPTHPMEEYSWDLQL